jgi:pimeloyl-ACP methyl ester carboxylesterase
MGAVALKVAPLRSIMSIMKRMLAGMALAAVAVTGLLALLPGASAAPEDDAFRAQVRYAKVGDQRIAWYERGKGAPLVMAIGTGSTMSEWDPALLRLLARERRLIMFDYPGIGLSSPLRGRSVTFEQLADVTAAFMEAIDVPQADVLGWSMGGFVAQQLVIRHPDAVRRLILAGTNPGGDAAVLGDEDDQEIDSDPDADEEAIISVLYPRTEAGRAEGRAFLRRLDDASETGEIPDDFDVPAATMRAQVAAEDRWLRSNANANALAKVTAPVLVTGGRRDPVTPPENARWIARRIPGAKLELFDDAHAYLFSERARFARVVDAFLD